MERFCYPSIAAAVLNTRRFLSRQYRSNMPSHGYEIDETRIKLRFSNDMRGDIDIQPHVLANTDGTVAVMDRKYLGDFISGAGVVKAEEGLPVGLDGLREHSLAIPSAGSWVYDVYELADGSYLALSLKWLRTSIDFLRGDSGYHQEHFDLYRPTGSAGADGKETPILLVSDHTPEEFVIKRLFGSKREFSTEYGAAACPRCEEVFEQHFTDCPTCGHRPESVENNISLIQEEHHGCMALIFPLTDNDGSLTEAVNSGMVEPNRVGESPDQEDEDPEAEAPTA